MKMKTTKRKKHQSFLLKRTPVKKKPAKRSTLEDKIGRIVDLTSTAKDAVNDLVQLGEKDTEVIQNLVPYFTGETKNDTVVQYFMEPGNTLPKLLPIASLFPERYSTTAELSFQLGVASQKLNQYSEELEHFIKNFVGLHKEEIAEKLSRFHEASVELADAFSVRDITERILVSPESLKGTYVIEVESPVKKRQETFQLGTPDHFYDNPAPLWDNLSRSSRSHEGVLARLGRRKPFAKFVIEPADSTVCAAYVEGSSDAGPYMTFPFDRDVDIARARRNRLTTKNVVSGLYKDEISEYHMHLGEVHRALEGVMPAYIAALVLSNGPDALSKQIANYTRARDNSPKGDRRKQLNAELKRYRPLVPFLEKAAALYH